MIRLAIRRFTSLIAVFLGMVTAVGAALAQETAAEVAPTLDSGDTAWMLTSSVGDHDTTRDSQNY